MSEDRPIFMMFCGLPGSGKSSFTKALRSAFRVVEEDGRLNQFVEEGSYDTYREAWLNEEQFALDICHARLQDLAEGMDQNVLFDGINLTVEARKIFLDMFPGHNKIALYWDYPLVVTKARLRARRKNTGKEIPFEEVEKMKETYVFPTLSEGFNEVHAFTIPPLHFEDYT